MEFQNKICISKIVAANATCWFQLKVFQAVRFQQVIVVAPSPVGGGSGVVLHLPRPEIARQFRQIL